jgi:glycosyltransferase involved in cell wall biosynthesis
LLEPRKISVIIPSSHGPESLKRFVDNLISKTSYPNYDVVIVQVGDRDKAHEAGTDFRLLHFPGVANAAAAKNYAVQQTENPWLLFLDAGVEPIETDWLTIMAEHVQRPEVGAVGARLISPNNTIEHAGLVDATGRFSTDRRIRRDALGRIRRDRSLSKNASRRLSDCLHPICEALLECARTREA